LAYLQILNGFDNIFPKGKDGERMAEKWFDGKKTTPAKVGFDFI